ncbi:hypothetical protein E3P84_01056 [Wallemia ichthyophaga]|nr:hypothetical protein E3P84_01056 [Wallemia ichthyophaga]TIB41569.1 hypothetical protein E3P83_01894 [Wallemia ichthyophaga]
MPHLYRHLRVNQIFGANTDVGKTLITTALVLAESQRTKNNIFYLKPVSTGPAADQDDAFLQRFSNNDRIHNHTLFRYSDPVSPHLAVSRESATQKPPSDKDFATSIGNYISSKASLNNSHSLYVETAGGVHSPTLTGTSQADAYRSLLLPTILIASSHLGGISTTLAAYESLHMRGYSVEAILVFREEYYANYQYLSDWGRERGVHVAVIDQPPSKDSNALNDQEALQAYFSSLSNGDGAVLSTLDELDTRHKKRIEEIKTMPQRTLDSIWYPFAQHSHIKSAEQIGVIDSAHADHFDVHRPASASQDLLQQDFDGSASWWTQTLGHGNVTLALAAAHAAGRYGHVLLPGHTHKPVLELCEKLLKGPGSGWANKAFVTDNGSTAMEVALKIALRACSKKYGAANRGVLGLSGSYHGDTIGSMDASEPSVYNNAVEWYSPRGGFWFDSPLIKYKSGEMVLKGAVSMGVPKGAAVDGDYWEMAISDSIAGAYGVEERLKTTLTVFYRDSIQKTLERLVEEGRHFGALVMEPLVMGAGGMLCVDRVLVDTVRDNEELFANQAGDAYVQGQDWQGLPVVFDEVFAGLYRLGQLTPLSIIGTHPDVTAYAKILSGGIVPLSTTLARQSLFDNFLGEEKKEALLHGHSYTAHPIGCAVANASLDEINKLAESDEWHASRVAWGSNTESGAWSLWTPEAVEVLSHLNNVDGVVALGSVLIIHLKSSGKGYESSEGQRFLASLASEGIHSRPLGDTVYFMASLNTSKEAIEDIQNKCIVVYAVNRHSKYQLALAANRDEWLERPTQPARVHNFGDDSKEECISGIDLLMQGTWIGVSKSGKIAALTNYFEPLPKDGKLLKSRGAITRDCLQSGRSIEDDLEEVSKIKDEVGPFNLLLIQAEKGNVRYGYATNRSISTNYHGMFSEDIGGMSNGYVDANDEIASQSEWHKVKRGKEDLDKSIERDMQETELLDTLENAISNEVHPMQTRQHFQFSARIPPIIMRPGANPIPVDEANKDDIKAIYATRLITFILVDNDGNVKFIEKDIYQLRGSDVLKADSQRSLFFDNDHVEHILRNARQRPLNNDEVSHVIAPISEFLFEKGKENGEKKPDWFSDNYNGNGILTEATAFATRLFAYLPPKEELLIYQDHLFQQLFSNPHRVLDWQLCKLQARYIYFRNISDKKLNSFFSNIYRWEAQAYQPLLSETASPLISLDNINQSLYHMCILHPEFFFMGEVISVMLPKLQGDVGFMDHLPPPPTILALTASDNEDVSQWANDMIDRHTWKPITKENAKVYLIIFRNILKLIVDRENGNLDADGEWPIQDDPEVLWTVLAKTLAAMDSSAIEEVSRFCPGLLKDVQRHLCDVRGRTFTPLLRCFVALISVKQTYWSVDSYNEQQRQKNDDEHSVLLLRLMNSVLDNPLYRPLVTQPVTFRHDDDMSWPLNWWSNLVMNVEDVHELHDSALRSIARRGFESTGNGGENTKYKYYENIIGVLEKCLNKYEGNERKMQLVFEILSIYKNSLLETAFLLQEGNPARGKSQEATRGLLRLCLRKDCVRLKRGLNDFMAKFTPWKDYERQRQRKKVPKEPKVELDTKKTIIATEIWAAVYTVIGLTNNIDDQFAWNLILTNLSSISHLSQLENSQYDETVVPARMKNTLLTFRSAYNNAINTMQFQFRKLVQNYLDDSTQHLQILEHTLKAPNVQMAIMRLYLSPNGEIHEPIISLLKMISDQDEKSEAIQWMLFKHPKTFLGGVAAQCKTFLSVADLHLEALNFANCISNQNEEILPMIASSSTGFLNRYGGEPAIKQALLEYWVELCRFTSCVLKSAPKWHRYCGKEEMISWMRESITLAGVLLDSEKELQRYITSVSSKMLEPLNEVLVQSVGWLRATDMTVVEFTFRFIDSTLSAFKQSECLPAPKALEMLNDYYRQANKPGGSVMKLSHLSLSKLKYHLSTFNDESDEEDVQIIDKKPSLGKLQKALGVDKKPSPADFLKEKQHERERQEKAKQAEQVKNPFMRKIAGKPLLTGLTTKKGEARKPFVAPQRLTYGGNKKEESESSDDGGDPGGLKDMDLNPEQAKQKMQAVKERRGGTKVIDPLVGTSTKKQQLKSDAKRDESFQRRQRLDPDISDLQKLLLNVDYNDPNMKIGSLDPTQRIPIDFRNYTHYWDIMRPLLFEETSEQLKQARSAVQVEETVTVYVSAKTFVNDYAEVVLNVKCNAPSQYSLSENELVTLSKDDGIQPGAQRSGAPTENHPCQNLIAKVQSFKRRHQDLIVTVWLPLRRSAAFQHKHKWKMQKFYSLSTLYREYGALKGLQYYGPVMNKILNPVIKDKLHLDSDTVKKTMKMLEVNESQANAVLSALCTPADGSFSLIQGPPGTGKSKTILALVAQFLSMRPKPIVSKANPNAADGWVPPKILLCAPSNAAIDEVVNRLKVPIRGVNGDMKEVNVIRIGADSSMSVSAKERSLEELVDQRVNLDPTSASMDNGSMVGDYRDQLTQCKNSINEIRNTINQKQQNEGTATQGEKEELRKLSDKRNEISTKLDKARDTQKSSAKARDASRRTHRRAVMMEADVVCSTLSGAGKGDLAELPVDFETVIIDEAAQAVEVSALIPFKYGCKRPILIGDQHQLPPTVMSTEASKKGYSRSLFVRLMETNKGCAHLLNEQYRMHPDISKLPSAVFYQGQLKDGLRMAEKTKAPWHDNALFGTYRFFDFAQGSERRVDHSYVNDGEADLVISLYERLKRQFGEEFSLDYRVAIIATYKQQVFNIKRKLRNRFNNTDKDILAKVDVNTVDGFQGQEKSVIILSTVRSSQFDNDGVFKDRSGGPIGFLKDMRRMNVALTRAQSSLFIVGNADRLSYDETWKKIVGDAQGRNLLEKVNAKYFQQPANHVAAKAKQPAKHPSGFEKDVRNNAKKNDKGEVEQQSIPDNLVPASNSPVKRKATAESGSSMAKKMKAAEMNQNDSNVIDIDGDQNSDIPGIRSDSVDQLVNAPVLESVNMDTDSSNRSQSVSVEPSKGPRTMMHNGTAQDDEQKKAIQAAHNRKKQAAKNNSMFINKKKPKK